LLCRCLGWKGMVIVLLSCRCICHVGMRSWNHASLWGGWELDLLVVGGQGDPDAVVVCPSFPCFCELAVMNPGYGDVDWIGAGAGATLGLTDQHATSNPSHRAQGEDNTPWVLNMRMGLPVGAEQRSEQLYSVLHVWERLQVLLLFTRFPPRPKHRSTLPPYLSVDIDHHNCNARWRSKRREAARPRTSKSTTSRRPSPTSSTPGWPSSRPEMQNGKKQQPRSWCARSTHAFFHSSSSCIS